jgi:hypothetical protein
MIWKKHGLCFDVTEAPLQGVYTHASIPFALPIGDGVFRVFYSSRDGSGKSLPFYVDAVIDENGISFPGSPVGPLFGFGELGTFDDSGMMPSSVVRVGEEIWMYYIGWNPQVTVSYRLSIGLAISKDGGNTFERYSQGPILDRDMEEPFFNTAPYVLREKENQWKMWYISCTNWEKIHNYPEPQYLVKMAESEDGVHWKRNNQRCIDYDDVAKAIGRPCVVPIKSGYTMFFSYRDIVDYRTHKNKGYQISTAQSKDGRDWVKDDYSNTIPLSDEGWDSMMMEYCHVFEYKGKWHMLYNGNAYGKDGFGYATSEG